MINKYKNRIRRQMVLQMDDLQYLKSLSNLGTYEDMVSIINYMTSKCLMTPDKLQGLLWFAYAWGLVVLNVEICPLQFIQTPYGPAELNVNKLYPIWDDAVIPMTKNPPKLHPKIEKLLDGVIDKYGSMPTERLSMRYATHCNNVPAGDDISAREIYLFFSAAILA